MTTRVSGDIISGKKEAELSVLTAARMARPVNKRSDRYFRSCGEDVSARFYFGGATAIGAKELIINDDIRVKEVRMLDENGDQMGIMGIDSAKEYAYDKGLDLVLIAPQGNPPVCRAMDYGKYRYECDKRKKEAKKKQQSVEVKEIQLSCRIDTHDFETKANRAVKFLGEGNKVRVCLKFRGREMAHQEIGRDMLAKFQDACADYGSVDKKPVLEGRQMTMFINPLKQSKDQPPKEQ